MGGGVGKLGGGGRMLGACWPVLLSHPSLFDTSFFIKWVLQVSVVDDAGDDAVLSVSTGRVDKLSAIMALPGEHFLRTRYPAAVASGGQDVSAGGQVLQGHHAQGQQSAAGYPSCNTARYTHKIQVVCVCVCVWGGGMKAFSRV